MDLTFKEKVRDLHIMDRKKLVSEIMKKKSMLCVGLDTRFDLLPAHLQDLTVKEAMVQFNKEIIDATSDITVSYKLNTAFYEQYGSEGWEIMEETLALIPDSIFTIADAKRGDIGNTSKMYANAFFKQMHFDAITVAPYMGKDSLSPFFGFDNKWVICLGLTSNEGSLDLQQLDLVSGDPVYLHTMKNVETWGNISNLMFVTGATHPKVLGELRDQFPEHFFLVPGVGAQGGSAKEVVDMAAHKTDGGLLINSSRGIIYASKGVDFAAKAREAAMRIVTDMQGYFA